MRITAKHLQAQITALNRHMGRDDTIYRLDATGSIIGGIAGTYCLSGAYGGWALERMASDGGTGTVDVFDRGHMPARELSGLISAYVRGLDRTE
jgi:hypothetical protein